MARTNTVRKAAPVANLNAVSARAFGKSIGKDDATNQSEADALHRQYNKSGDAAKKIIRTDFFIGYLAGRLGLNETDATAVHKAKRADVTKEQANAKMGASQKFLYLIARTGAKAVGGTGVGRGKGRAKKMRIPGEVLGLVEKIWTRVPGKSIADQRDMMIEAVKQLAAKYVEEANKAAAS